MVLDRSDDPSPQLSQLVLLGRGKAGEQAGPIGQMGLDQLGRRAGRPRGADAVSSPAADADERRDRGGRGRRRMALLVGTSAALTGSSDLDALGFMIAAGVMTGLPSTPAARLPQRSVGHDHRRTVVWRDRPYVAGRRPDRRALSVHAGTERRSPLFVVQRTSAPVRVVAVAFVINTIGVVTLQMRASRPSMISSRPSGALDAAGWSWRPHVWCSARPSCPRNPVLAAAIVLLGAVVQVVGEVSFAAGSWELGYRSADPKRPGEWQGLFNANIPVAFSGGSTAAHRAGGGLVRAGPAYSRPVLLAAAAAMAPAVRWAAATRPT